MWLRYNEGDLTRWTLIIIKKNLGGKTKQRREMNVERRYLVVPRYFDRGQDDALDPQVGLCAF